MIERHRAVKALARMRRALHNAWRKHDELLLAQVRQSSELANSLHREKHLLMDNWRFRGVDFEEINRTKEKIKEDDRLKRELDRVYKRAAYFMNKNSDLWLQLAKFPGGLEHARRIGKDDK